VDLKLGDRETELRQTLKKDSFHFKLRIVSVICTFSAVAFAANLAGPMKIAVIARKH